MSTPYFLAERLEGTEGSLVKLSGRESRHALRSLRLRPGDRVTVTDGEGSVGRGRLVSGDRGEALVEVSETITVPREEPPVSVALAAPAGDRLSWAVQKLSEIGVDELVVIETGRSLRRWKGGAAEAALVRLQSVAAEAAMQSRQAHLMRVAGALPFAEALDEGHATVVFSPADAAPLGEALPQVGDRPIRLFIGPEGGFTGSEIARAARAGARLATLGPRILRTETAAVVAAALVLARYGRLG